MIQAARQERQSLIEKAHAFNQAHILRWWDQLSESSRKHLLDQIRTIDFEQVQYFMELLQQPSAIKTPVQIEPVEYIPLPKDANSFKVRKKAEAIGERAIRSGRTGVFTVAGGQGTRLGYSGPKGTFRCSPVTRKSLFELQAERIRSAGEAFGVPIPWYIMTSPDNDKATRSFFRRHCYFGLGPGNVLFARQRMYPVLDENGKLILDARDHIAMSPNGHGGSFLAMQEGGVLEDAEMRGVEILSYYQVDNILIHVIDPVFVGFHRMAGAEMSSKMVRKFDPLEKVGHFVNVEGRLKVIEYSDLSDADMQARLPDGSLKYEAGSIGIHLINTGFAEDQIRDGLKLPVHIAHKKIPALGEDGVIVHPDEPNSYKFETFVFDALQNARKSVILEVDRKEEFSPIKNREGVDSPKTARQDLNNFFGSWLEAAGHKIPRDQNGRVRCDIEIHPLFARTKEEFIRKVPKQIETTKKIVFQPDPDSTDP